MNDYFLAYQQARLFGATVGLGLILMAMWLRWRSCRAIPSNRLAVLFFGGAAILGTSARAFFPPSQEGAFVHLLSYGVVAVLVTYVLTEAFSKDE